MSDKETSWILALVDKITKPMKDIIATVTESTKVIDKNTNRVILSEEQTKTALANTKKYYKDVQTQIKENEKELAKLQKEFDKTAPGQAKQNAFFPLEKSKKQLQELRKELKEAGEDIKDLEGDLTNYKKKAQTWEGMMTGANQTMEVIEKVSRMFDFAQPILNTRTEIERMTQAAGQELDELVSKTHKIGTVFNENDDDIARAANSMQKVWGGSYSEMINLLEQGYEKGANINKELLNSMKEYPVQMKEAGLNASETMALFAQANKDGVFNDKAIDSIKEANLALKEMRKETVAALKGIGISAKDLRGKTTFEAMKLISERMKTASTEDRQQVMAHVFKAAGEDAGMQFVLGLSSVDLNINNLPNVKQAGAGIKGFLADIQSWFANTFGGMVPYLQVFGQASSGILGVISLFQSLSKITALQTLRIQGAAAAQRIWNATMIANPIGGFIVGAAALGTAVYGITQKINQNSDAWKQQQAMMELNEELDKTAIQNTAEKTTKIKLLTETAANEKLSLDQRKNALKELIEIDSRYRAALQDGIIKTDELRKTTAQLTEEIYNNALAEAMRPKLVEIAKQELEAKFTSENSTAAYNNMSFVGKVLDGFKAITGDSEYIKGKDATDELGKLKRQGKELSRLIAIDDEKKYYLDLINGNKGKDKGKPQPSDDQSYSNRLSTPDFDFLNKPDKGRKGKSGGNREKDGLSISGGHGGSKTITQNLTVYNYFIRGQAGEDRTFADKIITRINDGLRDGLATI